MDHGEYKVPGGKLIVVDLDQTQGRISQLMISGDFFLEPDEALDQVRVALTGLPVDSSEAALAEIARMALADAELLGITPEGIAIAIRRALAGGAV